MLRFIGLSVMQTFLKLQRVCMVFSILPNLVLISQKILEMRENTCRLTGKQLKLL